MITSLTFTYPGGASIPSAPSLAESQTAIDVTLVPSNGAVLGTGVTIPKASASLAGVLDSARASKLDGLALVAVSGNYSDLIGAPSLTTNRGVGFPFVIDGGGIPIVTGIKGFVPIPYPATITGWTLLADVTGSISVDVWKAPFASYPPTVANTICGGTPPTLSAALSGQLLTLIGWSTAVAAGDVLGFNVSSTSGTITRVTVMIAATHL